MAPTPSLQELIDTVHADASGSGALDQLTQASATAAELGRLGDTLLDHFVNQCRTQGYSWSEISGSLGVSKQAAHKRYAVGPVTFERFTVKARLVVTNAAAQALQHGSAFTGSEHILLALFEPADSLAALALADVGVTQSACAQRLFGDGDSADAEPGGPAGLSDANEVAQALKGGGRVPYNEAAKNTLREAVEQALSLGHNYIGTEHILLALYRDPADLAAQTLVALGASAEDVRSRLIARLAGYLSQKKS